VQSFHTLIPLPGDGEEWRRRGSTFALFILYPKYFIYNLCESSFFFHFTTGSHHIFKVKILVKTYEVSCLESPLFPAKLRQLVTLVSLVPKSTDFPQYPGFPKYIGNTCKTFDLEE
jgi:hypothetical protein